MCVDLTHLCLADVSFTAWIFYAITLSGLIYLKIKKPELPRPFSVSIADLFHLKKKQHATVSSLLFVLILQQVPIILPFLVLIAAVFLVLAPIIDHPQIEYLYVTLFILSGAAIYVPFIHYKLCPGLLSRVTTFLQLFLEVAPADKNL